MEVIHPPKVVVGPEVDPRRFGISANELFSFCLNRVPEPPNCISEETRQKLIQGMSSEEQYRGRTFDKLYRRREKACARLEEVIQEWRST